MKHRGSQGARPPLDAAALERSALHYVERYATTRARLRSYLTRKLRERGWAGEGEPQVEALAAKLADLGYVDDAAYAEAKAAALTRRGYGARRVAQALTAAGIAEADRAGADDAARDGAFGAALRHAARRRIGPYAAAAPDPDARRKAFAAMMRAGHPPDLVRLILAAAPGEIPDDPSDQPAGPRD